MLGSGPVIFSLSKDGGEPPHDDPNSSAIFSVVHVMGASGCSLGTIDNIFSIIIKLGVL